MNTGQQRQIVISIGQSRNGRMASSIVDGNGMTVVISGTAAMANSGMVARECSGMGMSGMISSGVATLGYEQH